jgi:heme exporter protein CcmD
LIPVLSLPIFGYSIPMINWLDNPQSAYVLAAYGIAGACLLGLLLLSWRQARKRDAEWRRTVAKRGP